MSVQKEAIQLMQSNNGLLNQSSISILVGSYKELNIIP